MGKKNKDKNDNSSPASSSNHNNNIPPPQKKSPSPQNKNSPARRSSTEATSLSKKGHDNDNSNNSSKSLSSSIKGGLERVHVQHPGADRSALKELPALRDAPPAKREELFVLKLKLCSVIFSFDDPMADKRGKDMKRQTLLELVDYVNTPTGQKIFTESIMGDLMQMVRAFVKRKLLKRCFIPLCVI